MAPGAQALTALARWLITGEDQPVMPTGVDLTDRRTWSELVVTSDDHRLVGLVLRALDAGVVEGPREPGSHLRDLHEDRMRQCLLIERSLVQSVELLALQGIVPLVLKGAATAHLDYPDPSIRTFNDVDLLVRSDEVVRSIDALVNAGGRRDLPPRTSAWDTHFAKDVAVVDRAGVELDLHRSLVRGAFGLWMDADELHREPDAFDLGGTPVVALGPVGRVLHAAIGLTVGEPVPRLAHAVDFCLAARRVDCLESIERYSRQWKLVGILGEAVDLVTATLGVAPVTADGVRLPGGARYARDERVARRSYRSQGGSNTAELLGGLRAIPNLGLRLSYLRGLVLPDPGYRAARRQIGRSREWTTGVRELVRRR